eukprot:3115640-Rhodomonas_salina.1
MMWSFLAWHRVRISLMAGTKELRRRQQSWQCLLHLANYLAHGRQVTARQQQPREDHKTRPTWRRIASLAMLAHRAWSGVPRLNTWSTQTSECMPRPVYVRCETASAALVDIVIKRLCTGDDVNMTCSCIL